MRCGGGERWKKLGRGRVNQHRGLEGQIVATRVRGRAGDSEDGLRKGKPEFNGDAGFRDAVDGGSEGERISNTSGTVGRIDSDWSCNRTALMVAETKICLEG